MTILHALQAFVAERIPLFSAAGLAILVAAVVRTVGRWGLRSLSDLPVVDKEIFGLQSRRDYFHTHASDLYGEGYSKYNKLKNAAFALLAFKDEPLIVVPPRLVSELQKLPDDVLSMYEGIKTTMQSKHTGLTSHQPIMTLTVKANLVGGLERLNPTIAEGVSYALDVEFGECRDWTKIYVMPKLLRTIAITGGHVFVGPELSRTEAYIDVVVHYTVDLMAAVRTLRDLPVWRRSLTASFLPEVRKLKRRVRSGMQFFRTVLRERLARAKDPGWVQPDDMMQWMMNRLQTDTGAIDEEYIADALLALTLVSTHTTGISSSNAFYTMAAHPEHIKELRDEIETVLAAHGGEVSSAALKAMVKLDSYMRESSRFNAGEGTFRRLSLKPFTLSNGQTIPAGCIIEVPLRAFYMDPDVYPEPEKFDPWRFSREREALGAGRAESDASARNQYISVNQTQLSFGYGRHACPGRFFAANEIKMILVQLIRKFDFKLVDATERYKNLTLSGESIPDPTKPFLLKRVVRTD